MAVKKRKPKIPTHSEFMTRTRNVYHSHEQDLWEQLYGKGFEVSVAPSKRAKLPFGLDYLRMKLDEMLHEDDCRCRYCFVLLTVRNFSVDHRVPWERIEENRPRLTAFAPSPEVGYFAWENIDLKVCKRCNTRKGKLTDVEFRLILDFIATLPTAASAYILGKLASVPFRFFSKNKKKDGATPQKGVRHESAEAAPGLF